MNNPFISIIVPCYNAATYVSETIESVLGQDFNNWELLLINDGSKDSTLDILKSYEVKDSRIKVYDVPNGGVSKARNYGLEIANGDWVMFIDSDDWFEDKAFSTICGYMTNNPQCDVFGFNHLYNSENKQWKRGEFMPSILKRNGKEVEWFMLDTMFPYYDSKINHVSVGAIRGAWGKIFRKSLIAEHKIRFTENLNISEDAIFCLDVFHHAKEVVLVNDYLIHYRVHSSSAMNKYTPNVVDTNHFALQTYLERKNLFRDKDKFDICYLGMVSECIFRTFKLYLLHKQCDLSFGKRKHLLMGGVNQEIIKKSFENVTLDYLPIGKKQLVYCAKHKYYVLMFLIAFVSLKILELKK